MDCNLGTIDIVHLHAVEETLRYLDMHGERTSYKGLVKHLSWYWMDHSKEMKHKPQGWVLDWIKCLTGEC
ncbi:hypothetical protein LCGC14_1145320 [marine sediment metagenome]|uniref:Uncharacterized protein n=1 Tax=marine sediment metagenome TaxID=412755 RepID=A0A0F9M1U6_9ZZZZ